MGRALGTLGHAALPLWGQQSSRTGTSWAHGDLRAHSAIDREQGLSTNPERIILLSPWATHCHRISEQTRLGKEFREIPMGCIHQWPWRVRTHQQPSDEEIPVLVLARSCENIQGTGLSLSLSVAFPSVPVSVCQRKQTWSCVAIPAPLHMDECFEP